MCNQVRGAVTRFWLDDQQYRFLRADFEETANPNMADVSQQTIRGSYDPHDDDIVSDVRWVRFTVRMQPNPAEWRALLPKLGLENTGGNNFALMTDFTDMLSTAWIDRHSSSEKYTDAIADKYIVRCQKGGTPATIDIQFFAKQEETDENLPDESLLAGKPYVMKNTTLTLEGNSHTPNMVAWGIDHHVDAEFNNSETATDACPATRDMFFATSVPYFTANQRALYTTRRDTPNSGAAGQVAFVRGNGSLTWNFGRLRSLPKPPSIMSRLKEVRNGLFYKVVRTDASPLLTVVSDTTE